MCTSEQPQIHRVRASSAPSAVKAHCESVGTAVATAATGDGTMQKLDQRCDDVGEEQRQHENDDNASKTVVHPDAGPDRSDDEEVDAGALMTVHFYA